MEYTVTIADGATEGIEINHDAKTIVITADINGGSTTDFSSITANEISEEIFVATDATTVNVTEGAFAGLSFISDDLKNASGTIDITELKASAADLSDPNNINEAVAPKGINVSTQEDADGAITVINDAFETVSAERSKLGAMQNRLEHTIANLGTSAENLQAAESRIRDVDMAQEMMEFTKNNILQQAATAMLAQANMLPQTSSAAGIVKIVI